MFLKNRYIIYGRVQGVGFRRFAQRCANEFSIGGWVKNRPDGNVKIEAIGEKQQLNSFLSRISQGSWFSDVEDIEEISTSQVESPSTTFSIVR